MRKAPPPAAGKTPLSARLGKRARWFGFVRLLGGRLRWGRRAGGLLRCWDGCLAPVSVCSLSAFASLSARVCVFVCACVWIWCGDMAGHFFLRTRHTRARTHTMPRHLVQEVEALAEHLLLLGRDGGSLIQPHLRRGIVSALLAGRLPSSYL